MKKIKTFFSMVYGFILLILVVIFIPDLFSERDDEYDY